jgi:hypothetical protein
VTLYHIRSRLSTVIYCTSVQNSFPQQKLATLIYPNLDLNNRVQRLLARLELGIPANLVELGTRIGRISNWGNYLNLLKAGIETVEQFENTRESVLLTCFENNLEKLEQVKLALENYRTENPPIITPPVLPLYED